jgi:hypothetical protein
MKKKKEEIEKLEIKLKVLGNRILYLETLTNEVLIEVESAYQEQIKELQHIEEEAQQKLLKIQETGDDA